jgi:hypothetical protein
VPVQLAGDIQDYQQIEAFSYDGLTAFVQNGDFRTQIFTRLRIEDGFVDSGATPLAVWRVCVARDCDTLVALGDPGGCQNGDVVMIHRDDGGAAAGCLYSTTEADGTCAAVCGSTFAVGSPVSQIGTAPGSVPYGLSQDGDVLVARDGSACGLPKSIQLAQRAAAGYTVYDLTADPNLTTVLPSDMYLGIDGNMMVFTKSDSSGFLTGARDGGSVGPLSEGPFDWIDPMSSTPLSPGSYRTVCCPVLSGDQLTFTFNVTGPDSQGIYQTRRATVADRFPPATMLPGDINAYEAIDGLSYDGRTAFVRSGATTLVFTRDRATDDFVLSSAPPLAAERVRAAGSCGTLIGMDPSSMCQDGDIIDVNVP